MPIHLHAYMKIALCIALQDYNSHLILQFKCPSRTVSGPGIYIALRNQVAPKVHRGYRTKINDKKFVVTV
jgi:hypothetical protein